MKVIITENRVELMHSCGDKAVMTYDAKTETTKLSGECSCGYVEGEGYKYDYWFWRRIMVLLGSKKELVLE